MKHQQSLGHRSAKSAWQLFFLCHLYCTIPKPTWKNLEMLAWPSSSVESWHKIAVQQNSKCPQCRGRPEFHPVVLLRSRHGCLDITFVNDPLISELKVAMMQYWELSRTSKWEVENLILRSSSYSSWSYFFIILRYTSDLRNSSYWPSEEPPAPRDISPESPPRLGVFGLLLGFFCCYLLISVVWMMGSMGCRVRCQLFVQKEYKGKGQSNNLK